MLGNSYIIRIGDPLLRNVRPRCCTLDAPSRISPVYIARSNTPCFISWRFFQTSRPRQSRKAHAENREFPIGDVRGKRYQFACRIGYEREDNGFDVRQPRAVSVYASGGGDSPKFATKGDPLNLRWTSSHPRGEEGGIESREERGGEGE